MPSATTNNIVKGVCFCGEISFEVRSCPSTLYQCHCSECRKTTGSSANAGFLVAKKTFCWLTGEDKYKTCLKDTGYRVNFCSTCGSPVPNKTSMSDEVIWVPAGLLENEPTLRVSQHIFIDSKASWDVIAQSGEHHQKLPDDVNLLLP